MTLASLGADLLVGALVLSVAALFFTGFALWRKSVRAWWAARGALATTALWTSGAVFILEFELVTSNFSVADVANETSRALPLYLKMTALWSGAPGSLLFWTWILSLFTAYVALRRPGDERRIVPYASLILTAVLAFYQVMVAFLLPPLATLSPAPYGGLGLDPLLQNIWMAIHPPNLYMGFIAMTVPFAFGMGSLWAGEGGDLWVRISRRWVLVAWTFLTAGLVLGGYWSYTELGWGGYWAWDPVENAAFMPWLAATALLHSGMVQERRGLFRLWNMILLAVAFSLTVFGTFLTRSGFLPSIHTFSQSPVAGPFLVYFLCTLAFSALTIATHRHLLRDVRRLESNVSKEASFMLNNLFLLIAAFAVFWGTLFPILSRIGLGQEMGVPESFFTSAIGPAALAVFLTMGLGTALGWRRTSARRFGRALFAPALAGGALTVAAAVIVPNWFGHQDWRAVFGFGAASFAIAAHLGEFGRAIRARRRHDHMGLGRGAADLIRTNPHRYLGYVVHIAMAMMFIGIAGSWLFQQRTTLSVHPGQKVQLQGGGFRYQGLSRSLEGANVVYTATVENLATGATMTPQFISYPGNQSALSRPAIVHGVLGDLYVVLAKTSGQTATLEFIVNPLVTWFWGGALLTLIAMVVLLVRDRRSAPLPVAPGLARGSEA